MLTFSQFLVESDEPHKNHWRKGEEAHFEYHCARDHNSGDAEAWYRSHQKVKVLKTSAKGYGKTMKHRGANGEPKVYHVEFPDGHKHDAFEDELFTHAKHLDPSLGPGKRP